MKISLNWLKDFIETDLAPAQLEQVLTNCGLEVEHYEAYESIKGGLQGMVTGHVTACSQHPNADRLRLTTVDIGTGTDLNIVCGAPNVAQGQKVIVATVGATLYPTSGEPFKISKSKIRGEVSEGMICAEDEIGLGAGHDGIMVLPPDTAVGLPAAQVLQVYTDTVFEIGLTPNRGDAASHMGVARDIYAVNCDVLKEWQKQVPASTAQPIEVLVEEPGLCPRYTGISISGVKVQPSPAWLQNRLKAIGIGPINNVVDITNYVLHSIGQPIHAFDADELAGKKIVVKKAEAGTKFTTLDKTERTLLGHELMICDAEKPLAIAGVFGGLHSGITEKTTNVFIESACFQPVPVRKTAKAHGLNTDASFRFERGTDITITREAAKLTASLILEIAGGTIASGITDVYPTAHAEAEVEFSVSRFYALAGKQIPLPKVKEILQRLDIRTKQELGDRLSLIIPAYRTDVTRDVDVAEEIMRVYGYNNIEIPTAIRSSMSVSDEDKKHSFRNRVADMLAHEGFYEVYGFSLTSSANYTEEEKASLVPILNPLSNELDVLRQTMLFYGLETIRYNTNRKQQDMKLFEFGKTYHKNGAAHLEYNHLALWLTGNMQPVNWTTPAQPAGFYHLKTYVQQVLDKAGLGDTVAQYGDSTLLTNRVSLMTGNAQVAEFGLVKPALLKKYDINSPVYFADLNLDLLTQAAITRKFEVKPVSRFPEVRRDLSMLIDSKVQFAQLEQVAHETEKKLLRQVDVFDVYEGDKLPAGKKSYALSFTLQDDEKTLTNEQIEKVMQRLIENFRSKLNAEIRQ